MEWEPVRSCCSQLSYPEPAWMRAGTRTPGDEAVIVLISAIPRIKSSKIFCENLLKNRAKTLNDGQRP